jgi:hypothetical protein
MSANSKPKTVPQPQEFYSRGHIARSTGTGMVYSSVADPDPGFGAFLIPESGIRDW